MTDGLVDLLDTLLDTGVGVQGDVTLAVADIDLVRLRLRALLASVEAEERPAGQKRERDEWLAPPRRHRQRPVLPSRIDTEPESVDRGLAQLVLVVTDVLREVMERQAIRRLRSGTLAPDEVERLSEAFAALDRRFDELYVELGLDTGESLEPSSSPMTGIVRPSSVGALSRR